MGQFEKKVFGIPEPCRTPLSRFCWVIMGEKQSSRILEIDPEWRTLFTTSQSSPRRIRVEPVLREARAARRPAGARKRQGSFHTGVRCLWKKALLRRRQLLGIDIGFRSTKSGAGEQFPLLDFTAKGLRKRIVFVHRHR